MRARSLRTRVLVASSAILIALIGATLLYVGWQANRLVSNRLAADLARRQEQIGSQEASQRRALQATAELLASFPELRALLSTDAATIRDFLLHYERRAGEPDLLVALDPDGRIIARTDALTPLMIDAVERRWLEPALRSGSATGWLAIETGVYEAALAPAEAGGNVFGFLLVGIRLDDAFARRLRDPGHDEVVILGTDGVLGSTLPARQLPWQSVAQWDADARGHLSPHDVDIAGETYVVLARGGGPDSPVRYLTLQSRDQALAPYRRIQAGLLLLGIVVASAGIAASAWLARSLTAPLVVLADGTRRVTNGDFEVTLAVTRSDEIGDLARAFNVMTRGLRERADMQKFVSQSTVDMIQAQAAHTFSAGERRRLTILISDLRGFTALTEQRAPEEVVALLDRCLGVEADRVRKHGGDIDKYVGDSLIGLFAGDDMELAAVRCAIEIHRALEATSRETGTPLEAGIGIATGEVVLGTIGSDTRRDYTVVGTHVNLAARLCTLAGGREVLMAESTWMAVRDLVAAERLEAVVIRGIQTPMTVYRMRVLPTPDGGAASQGFLS